MQPARIKPHAKEHTNNPVQKPNFRGHAVPAVPKFEPDQGIPPFCPSSASTRLPFQSPLLATPSRLADFHLDPAVLPAPPCLGGSAAVPAIPLVPPRSLTSASTRLSFQLHLVLEVERLFQPSPLSPWQVPGQARARMQHKHKQARHEQAHSVM